MTALTLCALTALLRTPFEQAANKLSNTIEVPFKIGESAIIVDAVINGKPLSLMFDTGFSGEVVLGDTINIGKPTGSMTLRDFVGQFEAPTVKLTSMKIGALSVDTKDMEAVMQRGGDMSFSYNTHTDGILGLGALAEYVTEINFEKLKFIFHPKNYDITKMSPDGKKTFLCKLLPIGNNSMEMEVVASTGKKLTLALDTGNSFYATTHKDVLERVGMWVPGTEPKFVRSSFVASGPVDSWTKKLRDVTIFGVPVKTSVWDIIDLPSSSAEGDGTVGFGFLRNFNITFDMERRRVWLDNFNGKVDSEEEGDLGIIAAFDQRAKRVRVYRVSNGSPAEKQNVKRGDAILSIDGEDPGNATYRQMMNLLKGPIGSKVKLALSRDGQLIRVEVERQALIND